MPVASVDLNLLLILAILYKIYDPSTYIFNFPAGGKRLVYH